MRTKNILFFLVILFLMGNLCACEAFVKKFTRKSKKTQAPEEMVFLPEDYPSLFANAEEAYRQYFFYWKSWQDELISALISRSSQKKQLSCIDEAIENLNELRQLLNDDMVKKLDAYIAKEKELRSDISKDIYSSNSHINRSLAEKIKRSILRDFSYLKIKDYLK